MVTCSLSLTHLDSCCLIDEESYHGKTTNINSPPSKGLFLFRFRVCFISYCLQILVGWSLTSCLIISMSYKSALIAHLTVQGKTRPVETFNELVQQPGWGWAMDPWMLTGIPYQYFSEHTYHVMKRIYSEMEASSV